MLSLIIPVYKNEENLPRLLNELAVLNRQITDTMEVVFVVDGSPDRCHPLLQQILHHVPYNAQLILLTRNFGSFSAVSAGLAAGNGEYFAVLAADLQEPPGLVLEFAEAMRHGEADIVFGVRSSRSDPLLSHLFSSTFWWLYRRFVLPEMPPGGVDVFGCTRQVRDKLLSMKELNTNLIALLFWLGYRRKYVSYRRMPRLEGRSAWTLGKKLRYCINSIFSFTDLPVRALLATGGFGSLVALLLGTVVFVSKLLGLIREPGYTPIIIAIMFFGGLTTFGLGIIGQYLWISLQNTRNRPEFIVWHQDTFAGGNGMETSSETPEVKVGKRTAHS
jgi:glycosyltransferase involved in cell wall biosynthesis